MNIDDGNQLWKLKNVWRTVRGGISKKWENKSFRAPFTIWNWQIAIFLLVCFRLDIALFYLGKKYNNIFFSDMRKINWSDNSHRADSWLKSIFGGKI